MMFRIYSFALNLFKAWLAFFLVIQAVAHEGPDPLGHWIGQADRVKDGKMIARLGPDGTLSFKPNFIQDRLGQSMFFEGPKAKCLLAADFKSVFKVNASQGRYSFGLGQYFHTPRVGRDHRCSAG